MKMWPLLLDMSKVDCKRMLRRLELEAYGTIVSALRAQGGLSSEKRKLLQEISSTLNIPQERHRAEIRRAVNDERLATVAYCMTGDDTTDEWAQEGRRLIPLMPRMVPQTTYSVIADDEANKASIENEKLPLPVNTERKRPLQTSTGEPNRNIQYATSEFSAAKYAAQCNIDEGSIKKRKTNVNMEGSTLAQHLIMGPPKISRIQQLYRQKNKAILKQQMKHQRTGVPTPTPHITNIQKTHRKIDDDSIKNISHIQSVVPVSKQQSNIVDKTINTPVAVVTNAMSIVTNENNTSQSKITTGQTVVTKPVTSCSNTIKVQQAPVVVNANEVAKKSVKICPARKVITGSRNQPQSQKLIIVSNSQGSTTPSILQRTLTIPYLKTISMKNLDKLKVISSTSSSVTTNVTTSVTIQKPKLLAVKKMKTNSSNKPISIPFIQSVQLQALQNKGAIKMVPLSTTTKITSKPTVINTTSGSVYIMNSNTNIAAVTASNSSPIMTTKAQTSNEIAQETTQKNIYIIKNDDNKQPTVSLINNSENPILNQNVVLVNVQQQKTEQKSSVLTDILKASGVIPNDETETSQLSNETDLTSQDPGDIETQISQFTVTATPNSKEVECITNICDSVENSQIEMVEEVPESQEVEQYESIIEDGNGVSEAAVEGSNYVILEEGAGESEMLVCEMEDDQQKQTTEVLEVMGNLDPETGMYSIQETTEEIEGIVENVEEHDQTSSYVIEMDAMHNPELDMPTLELN